VVQQIPQPAGGDRGFISDGLDLIGVVEHLILLSVAEGSVVFIIFTCVSSPAGTVTTISKESSP
jgi:hypothetical protein